MLNKIIFNLPQKINTLVWKKKGKYKDFLNITIFNEKKKINFFINYTINPVFFDKNTNSFIFEKKVLGEKNNKLSSFIQNFIKSWDVYFFSKIKFKGKGFRMRFLKKNKLIKFFFGRSHKTFILFRGLIMRRINKYKFILKSINKRKISVNSKLATNIKPVNVYTIRGIRNSRQIIFKRKGKKGTYI